MVDLIESHDMAGVALNELEVNLSRALAAGRFDPGRLRKMAIEYGTRGTEELVERALERAT